MVWGWQGMAHSGSGTVCLAQCSPVWHSLAWHGAVWHITGLAKAGTVCVAQHILALQSLPRHDTARHGTAWHSPGLAQSFWFDTAQQTALAHTRWPGAGTVCLASYSPAWRGLGLAQQGTGLGAWCGPAQVCPGCHRASQSVWPWAALPSTAQHSQVWHSMVQHGLAWPGLVQHGTAQPSPVQPSPAVCCGTAKPSTLQFGTARFDLYPRPGLDRETHRESTRRVRRGQGTPCAPSPAVPTLS